MSYADVADVKAYFPGITIFDGDSAITDTSIQSWLDQDNARINSRISKITDLSNITTSGLIVLRQVNAMMSACKVDDSLPYFNTRTKEEEKNKRDLCQQAEEILKGIENREIIISDSYLGSLLTCIESEDAPPIIYSKETIF